MDTLRIKNLRSLKDTGEIEIKPLTVLVGENSSGKSSFLRFFPLLKQTLETKRSETILWYSNRYVDFGSFNDALNKKSQDGIISFEISFSVSDDFIYRVFRNPYIRRRVNLKSEKENNINNIMKVNVCIKQSFVDNIDIEFNKNKISIKFNELLYVKSIKINNTFIDNIKTIKAINRGYVEDILPELFYECPVKENLLRRESTLRFFIKKIKQDIPVDFKEKEYFNDLEEIILTNFDWKELKIKYNDKDKNLENLTNYINNNEKMKDYMFGMMLDTLIYLYNIHISDIFSNVRYIAPVRANAERYYRVQGLAINEIDPKGENIAMLLYNLGENEKNKFCKWVKENFDFEIFTKSEGGHVSIYIRYSNEDDINIVDTGFGYSQILPIIVQLWLILYNTNSRPIYLRTNIYILVIEQPELHLHPAMQGQLVDTFVKALDVCKKNNIDLRFVIETHSKAIVNRIGYLIHNKKYNFNEKQANIVIFNKKNNYESSVEKSGYDSEGYLENWPIGFFNTRGL